MSILFVFSSLFFASEAIDVKEYIKGKFPVIFNIYLASLEGLDQYEKEFIDLLQNLPEEEQKNFAKEVYNNGFSKGILAKIKDALLLNVPLFLEGAVDEKFPEKSFTWNRREGIIITSTGDDRVEGYYGFVKELDKAFPNLCKAGSHSLLDFTKDKIDLESMRNTHTIFTIRPDITVKPENLEELGNLEAKHPDLVPLSCNKLKYYSFPLICFSRDLNGKIRGVIIADEVTPSLARLLIRDTLPLDVPFWYEDEQLIVVGPFVPPPPSVFPPSLEIVTLESPLSIICVTEDKEARRKEREKLIRMELEKTTTIDLEKIDKKDLEKIMRIELEKLKEKEKEVKVRGNWEEFYKEMRKFVGTSIHGHGRPTLIPVDREGREERWPTHNTIYYIHPNNLECLRDLEAYPQLLPLSYNELESELKFHSPPLFYFFRDIEADKIRGIILARKVYPELAKLFSKGIPLDVPFRYEYGQLQILE